MTSRLNGRTALVTGSTSNIGRAIAQRFAVEGAFVIVSGRDEERGALVVDGIARDGGRAVFVQAELDGSVEASAQLAEKALAAAGGRLDILVNNAGIFPPGTTLTVDAATVDCIYAVNVKAPIFLVQALAPAMAQSGGGAIVNLGSWVARLSVPVGAVYASSKGAMETLTRAWSAEFAPLGIRVNAVSPGVIRSPELPEGVPHAADRMMAGTPAGHAGHPDAIAAAVAYLASDDAAFVHGAVLDVDGGRANIAVVRE